MFIQAGRWSPQLLAALRIVAGLLFLAHGVVKVFGFPAGAEPGQQALASLFGIGGIIEIVTGGLLILGLFTRPAAFIASGQMAVAYFMMHAKAGNFWRPLLNGGEAAVLFSFVFLYLFVAGPGAWSVDGRRA